MIHTVCDLMESTQVHSPGSDASSSGESMSSDTHLLPIAAPLQQRIAFPYSQHQQVGFPTVGELDQAAATEGASSWSSRVWDHGVGGVEAGGDLSGGRTEWDVKTHFWDWVIGEGDEDGGLHPREPLHIALQSGSNKTGVLSHSSGIPGVAATGKGGHGKICSSEHKRVAVDCKDGSFTGFEAHSCGKTEHYRSGGEQNSHREFTLGQDENSSWDLQNTVTMHRIEPSRRTMLEKQHNESLKRSDQHFVEQQNLSSRDSQKVVGFFSLGGSAAVKIENSAKIEEKDTCSNGGTGSGGDLIGLKLGKRTYFGDTAAVSAGKSAGAPIAVSPIPSCSSSGRRRGTAASHIPRCQVEGCRIDLSTAKEYHKRHKVCAPHSKAPKVIVATTEQRFCQQCSKFHGLSAFDEGKRSCRRRLAGHNERRRKPQPDSLALASGGASLLGRLPGLNFGADHYHVHGLEDPHYLWQQLQPTVAPSHNDFNGRLGYLAGGYSRFGNLGNHGASFQPPLQIPATMDSFLPSLPKPAADRLLMILPQHPSSLAINLDDNRINQMQQGYDPMGPALSLSPSSGTRCLGLETSAQASHGLSAISDSGCALSLLSSQPWGSMTPSLSFDLSSRPPMLQILAENAAPFAQQIPHRASAGVHHEYVGLTDEAIFTQPLSQRGAISAIPPSAFQATPQVPFGVSSEIDTHTMLAIPHGHDCRSLHSSSSRPRPTIDLMESPSSHLHHSRLGQVQTANRDFLEFQSSKPLDSAMYDTQTML